MMFEHRLPHSRRWQAKCVSVCKAVALTRIATHSMGIAAAFRSSITPYVLVALSWSDKNEPSASCAGDAAPDTAQLVPTVDIQSDVKLVE